MGSADQTRSDGAPPCGSDDLRVDARRNVRSILEAAARVLAEDPAASMQEIADVAEVSRPTVYRHFSNREELIDAIRLEAMTQARETLDAAAASSEPAADALERLILDFAGIVASYPLLASLIGTQPQTEGSWAAGGADRRLRLPGRPRPTRRHVASRAARRDPRSGDDGSARHGPQSRRPPRLRSARGRGRGRRARARRGPVPGLRGRLATRAHRLDLLIQDQGDSVVGRNGGDKVPAPSGACPRSVPIPMNSSRKVRRLVPVIAAALLAVALLAPAAKAAGSPAADLDLSIQVAGELRRKAQPALPHPGHRRQEGHLRGPAAEQARRRGGQSDRASRSR